MHFHLQKSTSPGPEVVLVVVVESCNDYNHH